MCRSSFKLEYLFYHVFLPETLLFKICFVVAGYYSYDDQLKYGCTFMFYPENVKYDMLDFKYLFYIYLRPF